MFNVSESQTMGICPKDKSKEMRTKMSETQKEKRRNERKKSKEIESK